jgi:Flp pilus assembly protein TadB
MLCNCSRFESMVVGEKIIERKKVLLKKKFPDLEVERNAKKEELAMKEQETEVLESLFFGGKLRLIWSLQALMGEMGNLVQGFEELQKQNERLIAELSKKDDSHSLLLQVIVVCFVLFCFVLSVCFCVLSCLCSLMLVVVCVFFFLTLCAQQKSASRQLEAVLREEKNELALKMAALKKLVQAQKNQITHLVKNRRKKDAFL